MTSDKRAGEINASGVVTRTQPSFCPGCQHTSGSVSSLFRLGVKPTKLAVRATQP